MRLPASLGLACVLGLVLACSVDKRNDPQPTEPEASGERPSFAELRPHVGDPAPAISLESLAGSRVELPMSNADRAAILIFGSFS